MSVLFQCCLVAAHQIDRPDVGRPLAPDEPEALAAPVRRIGEQDLQMRLHAVLLQVHRVEVHRVVDVGQHLHELYV